MYPTYPNYNTLPPDPAMLAMQERLKQMQRQQQMYQPMPQPQYSGGVKGRMVTSIDEARAAQIDFDGSASYFPCPAERKIYVKSLDLNGNPVFEVYQLMSGNVQQPTYVESSAFAALQQRVEQLEAALKGANNSVQQSNAVNTNDERQP